MTLTTPGCTMGQHMADDIKSKLENLIEEKPPWLLGQFEKFFSISLNFFPGVKFSIFLEIILVFGRLVLSEFDSGLQ